MSIERLATGLQIIETAPAADGLELQWPLTWSIMAAVQSDPDATLRAVFSFSTQTGIGLSGYNLMCLNSKLHFYLRVGAPNAWKTIPALANVTVGRWYHCAGRVYDDGANVQMEFWIDGVSQGTLSWPTATLLVKYASTLKIQIGSYGTANINCYAADFAIWNVKLSDAEIVRLAGFRRANVPLMIQPGSGKGYWRFDESNDGENVFDNLKFYFNYSAGTGNFTTAGSGAAYGRLSPCPHDFGVQVISFEAAAVPPSFRGLALLGVGR